MAISYTDSYTTALTLAGRYLEKSKYIPDNIFKGLILAEYLMKNGNIKTAAGAGDYIEEPLMYAKNTTAGSYAGYDILDTTPQDPFTMARFQWKQLAVSVSLSGRMLRARKGPHEVTDLWQAEVDNGILSLHDILNTQLYGDGSANDNKDIGGILAAIPEDPTAAVAYGGIDGSLAANSWWRSFAKSALGSFADNGYDAMETQWRKQSVNRKSGVPDLWLMTSGCYGFFVKALVKNERFMMVRSKQPADPSFGALDFKGIPVEFDENFPKDSAGTPLDQWVALCTKYLFIRLHKDANFTPTPWVKPPNQDAIVSQILAQLELTCRNRRHQGRTFGVTA